MSVLLMSYLIFFTWETFDLHLHFLFQNIISLQMLVYYLDDDKYTDKKCTCLYAFI